MVGGRQFSTGGMTTALRPGTYAVHPPYAALMPQRTERSMAASGMSAFLLRAWMRHYSQLGFLSDSTASFMVKASRLPDLT